MLNGKYDVKNIARWLVWYFYHQDKPFKSNLQLQKLLILLNQKYYENFGIPLFTDYIEQWRKIYVYPSVYWEYCAFGANTLLEIYEPEKLRVDSDTDKLFILSFMRDNICYENIDLYQRVKEVMKNSPFLIGTDW